MTKKTINIGQSPNDQTGDSLRAAFGKINDNFTEVYATINTGSITKILHGANGPSTARGAAGDKAGMIVVSGAYLFYCYADYTNGNSPIWQKVSMDNTDWD